MKSEVKTYSNRLHARKFKFSYPQKAASKLTHNPAPSSIPLLKQIKSTLQSLPTHSNYKLQKEMDYLRDISELLLLFKNVRLEQISYVVSEESFKKIVIQLVRQREHKQIVIALIKEIAKGIEDYQQAIGKDLYDILEIMIEMEDLGKKIKMLETGQADLQSLQGRVQALAVHQLIQSINRWYAITPQGKELAQKYQQLLHLLQK